MINSFEKKYKSVAVIPVREGSRRVANKNFREFVNGKSLLELKIEQLKNENCFDNIFISSDSTKAEEIAAKYGVQFLFRQPDMCSSTVRWSDVIYAVVNSIPAENPIVSWIHTTSPLHTSYSEPLKTFIDKQNENDSLVAVTSFQEFIMNKNGRPVNYHWGVWHDYSQDLETLYKVTGALFIAFKMDILKWRYLIGIKPFLYLVDKDISIDVDNPEDFEFAKLLYNYKFPGQDNIRIKK